MSKENNSCQKLLERLVESDEPLKDVWEAFAGIWDEASKKIEKTDECKNYYSNCEAKADELERFLINVNPSIYGVLLGNAENHLGPRSIFPSSVSEMIVVDGMSLREFFLLKKDLEEKGYRLKSLQQSFSAVPSETIPFAERVFGLKRAPSQLPQTINLGEENIRYVHVQGERAYIPLRPDPPFAVWVPLPDDLLKSPRRIGVTVLYRTTRNVVMRVIEEYSPSRFFLTSDHGYLLSGTTWELRGEVAESYRDLFHDARYADIEVEIPKELKGTIICGSGRSYLVSRYDWDRKGQKKTGFHGGISMTEVLTPMAIFER